MAVDGGLVSGGKDGSVRKWTAELEPIGHFSVKEMSGRSSVRAAYWDDAANKIVVGTWGSDILELDAAGANLHDGPVITGHFADELWGLAMNPTKAEYATVGDDHSLRIWDVATRKLLRKTDIHEFGRAVAYSPDGALLAVGMGGRVGRGRQKNDGKFAVYREDDLSLVKEARHSRQWISDVKFSPDGEFLAVGSHDNKTYLYKAPDWKLVGKAAKHNSYITHVDFSADSKVLRSTSGDYELLFYDVPAGTQRTSASDFKDIEWATETCVLGWAVQGIWPACADGTDINSIDRSHSGDMLLTADDFGKVKLFRLPCLNVRMGCRSV
jgi:WD40 repeat protein